METKIINEQLEDKQQIVTYKYLTKKLNIHPNKAKQILRDYVSKLTGDKKFSTTMVIGGILQENDAFCIVLVIDDHVETIRRRFKQISFEHLYSIQPTSNRLSDINNSLYLIDNSLSDHIYLSSSIKNKEKGNALLPIQNIDNIIEIDSTEKSNSAVVEVLNHTYNSIVKTKSDKIQKDTELEIFTKNKKTNSVLNETLSHSNDTIVKTKSEKTKKKGHTDFFNNFKKCDNSENTKIVTSIKHLEKNIEEDKKSDVILSKESIQKHSTNEHLTKNLNNSNTDVDKMTTKTSKKKERKIKNVKRKRIQTFDSSDEEIDIEEEDKKRSEHMDVDDEVDFVQPTPPRPTLRENRKKEKQIMTSTFIDDDGFVCTTKEIQFVETECVPPSEYQNQIVENVENVENSISKEINVEPANKKLKLDTAEVQLVDKKKNKITKQSKNSSSQGMKQLSLNNFFKTK